MTPLEFYKNNFGQYEENVKHDTSMEAHEIKAFYNCIALVDISSEVKSGEIDKAKDKLINETNQNIFWQNNRDGSKKYQYQGANPNKWKDGEDLGYVVKKEIYVGNLYQQTGKTKKAIEDQLEEIINESDASTKSDRFEKFKMLFGKHYSKKTIAMMWSFRYYDSKDKSLAHVSKDELPFILALPDAGNGKPYYFFKHKLKSQKPKIPRTFDTSIDNDVFRPGGSTFPIDKCKGKLGLKEIIHEPNNISDISDMLEEIVNYL